MGTLHCDMQERGEQQRGRPKCQEAEDREAEEGMRRRRTALEASKQSCGSLLFYKLCMCAFLVECSMGAPLHRIKCSSKKPQVTK